MRAKRYSVEEDRGEVQGQVLHSFMRRVGGFFLA